MIAGLEKLGAATDSMLGEIGLEPSALQNVEGRVPHSVVMRLWERAEAETDDEDIGIHVAEAAPIHAFGVHAYAILSSPTLRASYERACRYQRLIHEVTDLVLDQTERGPVLRHALPGGRAVPRQPAEFLATLWVRFGRQVTGDHWFPGAWSARQE